MTASGGEGHRQPSILSVTNASSADRARAPWSLGPDPPRPCLRLWPRRDWRGAIRGDDAGARRPEFSPAGSSRLRGLDSVARRSARLQLTSEAHRHYLDSLVQTTDSVLRHWPVADTPIWFTLVGGGTPDFRPELLVEVRAALDAWSPLALGSGCSRPPTPPRPHSWWSGLRPSRNAPASPMSPGTGQETSFVLV